MTRRGEQQARDRAIRYGRRADSGCGRGDGRPGTATDDGKKNKDQDPTGEEDTNTKSPRPSSSAKGETSSSASASASPSTAAALGVAGRADCRYNWDRTQVMAKGMVGSKVKQIQCLLNYNYDYTLTLDGKFGESADVAVRAVQSCSGLKPDGQVGPQTWKYLDTPVSGPTTVGQDHTVPAGPESGPLSSFRAGDSRPEPSPRQPRLPADWPSIKRLSWWHAGLPRRVASRSGSMRPLMLSLPVQGSASGFSAIPG
ncbi:peptidoglycan-binding domain-containing protein [Streptomyces atratus]|uniref:peptidoglycan-binding domain-containing protein n=1 Tax=Streptomyces atratus TaxID=1893 RepID=UPI001160F55F|nr:peptidoglycan-binding domain-containing protein [Streptomyces atratus]